MRGPICIHVHEGGSGKVEFRHHRNVSGVVELHLLHDPRLSQACTRQTVLSQCLHAAVRRPLASKVKQYKSGDASENVSSADLNGNAIDT